MSKFHRAVNPLGPGRREEWRLCLGFLGYRVSNMGRVKNPRGELMNQGITRHGYVWCGGMGSVHRLVAKAFIPRIPGKPFVNHMDCRKTRNCVANLEWVTHKENCAHAAANGRYLPTTGENHWTRKTPDRRKIGELNGRAKLTAAQVKEIKYALAAQSLTEVGKRFGVTKQAIYRIRKGLNWRTI